VAKSVLLFTVIAVSLFSIIFTSENVFAEHPIPIKIPELNPDSEKFSGIACDPDYLRAISNAAESMSEERDPQYIQRVLTKWFYDCNVENDLRDGVTNSIILEGAMKKFVVWQFEVETYEYDEIFPPGTFADLIDTSIQRIVSGINNAIIEDNKNCKTQTNWQPYVEDIFRWATFAQQLRLDTQDNLLDTQTIVDELCYQIVFEQVDIPQTIKRDETEEINIRVGYKIGNGPTQFGKLDIWSSDNTSPYFEGETDSLGYFTKEIKLGLEHKIIGYITAMNPKIPILAKTITYEIDEVGETQSSAVAWWNIKVDSKMEGNWKSDIGLFETLIDKTGCESGAPAGVTMNIDAKMRIEHTNIHFPPQVSLIASIPPVSWYVEDWDCSSIASSVTATKSISCDKNSGEIKDNVVQMSGLVDPSFQIYSIHSDMDGPVFDFEDGPYAETVTSHCKIKSSHRGDVLTYNGPSCTAAKKAADKIIDEYRELPESRNMPYCMYKGYDHPTVCTSRITAFCVEDYACHVESDTKKYSGTGIDHPFGHPTVVCQPIGYLVSSPYTTYSDSDYSMPVRFQKYGEFIPSDTLPLKQGTYQFEKNEGGLGASSLVDLKKRESVITLTPSPNKGAFVYNYGPDVAEPNVPTSVLETLKDLTSNAGGNSLTILQSYSTVEKEKDVVVVAISQASIFNPDKFESQISSAMAQGKITSLVKPGEDTWYMKQYPENWAGYENYALLVEYISNRWYLY